MAPYNWVSRQELKPKMGDVRGKLLENMALVATKNKTNVERALSTFMSIASTEVRLSLYVALHL